MDLLADDGNVGLDSGAYPYLLPPTPDRSIDGFDGRAESLIVGASSFLAVEFRPLFSECVNVSLDGPFQRVKLGLGVDTVAGSPLLLMKAMATPSNYCKPALAPVN